MLRTVKEANGKNCPFKYGAFPQLPKLEGGMLPQPTPGMMKPNCDYNECMAWKWHSNRDQNNDEARGECLLMR